MHDSSTRLTGFLFGATLLFAGTIGAFVVVAPYMLGERADASDLLVLFARDMTVRRTAFFAAIGLVATSFIFFRPTALKKKKDVAPASRAA